MVSVNPWTITISKTEVKQKAVKIKRGSKPIIPSLTRKQVEAEQKGNLLFVDVGELGWSLYLVFHIRWLKKNTNCKIAVMTYPARQPMYKGLADMILDFPEKFYSGSLSKKPQGGAGIYGSKPASTKKFFSKYAPEGYRIPNYFEFGCFSAYTKQSVRGPFPYSEKLDCKKSDILIFPRCRPELPYNKRNLPKQFYLDLINKLCQAFPKSIIKTIGTKSGAYDISVKRSNYINWIGKSPDIQGLIDACQKARAAVGSQSAPPKISLLQGVPTFMIGHQGPRHTRQENWMGTKAGFFHIHSSRYNSFNDPECIKRIVTFIKHVG